jgi:hypothetical protein
MIARRGCLGVVLLVASAITGACGDDGTAATAEIRPFAPPG